MYVVYNPFLAVVVFKYHVGSYPIIHKTYTQIIQMQARNELQVAMYEHVYQFIFDQCNLNLFS